MHRMINYVQLVVIVYFWLLYDFSSLIDWNVVYKMFHRLKWSLEDKLMAVYNHTNAYSMYGCTSLVFYKTWRCACFSYWTLGRTYVPADSGRLFCMYALELSDPSPIGSNSERKSEHKSTASSHMLASAMHPFGRVLLRT